MQNMKHMPRVVRLGRLYSLGDSVANSKRRPQSSTISGGTGGASWTVSLTSSSYTSRIGSKRQRKLPQPRSSVTYIGTEKVGSLQESRDLTGEAESSRASQDLHGDRSMLAMLYAAIVPRRLCTLLFVVSAMIVVAAFIASTISSCGCCLR